MLCRTLALVAIAAGCSSAHGEGVPPDEGRLRYHMRQRLGDTRTIERLLVDGKLDDARALAYMLTRPAGVADETCEGRELALAAGALAGATTLEGALHAHARIAAACARCHTHVQKLPIFPTPSHAPPDRPSVAAQMARHQWAVDRLWEGIVGASPQHWRAGLYALATSRFPATTSPALATRMQALARAALDQPVPSLAAYAATYGELLLTCAGCHSQRASSQAVPRDPAARPRAP